MLLYRCEHGVHLSYFSWLRVASVFSAGGLELLIVETGEGVSVSISLSRTFVQVLTDPPSGAVWTVSSASVVIARMGGRRQSD